MGVLTPSVSASRTGTPQVVFAFPKSLRLRHRSEFKHTLDRGLKAVCREMVVFGHRREGSSSDLSGDRKVRLGLIVSKKVGNAAERNRMKRCLRESFRHLESELEASQTFQGMDLVIIARRWEASNRQVVNAHRAKQALEHCLDRFARQKRAQAKLRDSLQSHSKEQSTHEQHR